MCIRDSTEGADIVTDTNMALSGINKRVLARYGGSVHCFMAVSYTHLDVYKRQVLDAGLALGEGTGAVMMCGLLDIARTIYGERTTFADIDVAPYQMCIRDSIHPLHHRSYQVDSEQVSQHGEG